MQTLVISILSGLVGATIAAIFNYKIRLKMQEKARLEQEQNFAYVHVALLSQYAAIELWVRQYLDLVLKELDEPIPQGEFELEHVVSVYIAEAISKVDDEFFEKIGSVEILIDQVMEGFSNTYLTTDELSKLPRKTVIYYQEYEHFLRHVSAEIKILKTTITRKELVKLVDSKQIHSLIESVKSLFESAKQLEAALAVFGNVSPSEREKMVLKKYQFLSANMAKSSQSKIKLQNAKNHYDEHAEKS
ncbi:hypothetical protein ACEV9O_22580 [Vibrio parahaemolyticus]|uniref:hypothetical protein n=1 Tax=Vibrio parahaemolyticus TaxID=670 RepID=UPI00111F9C12|nr:hypothetical protein [Vibrio parahaemolyticus]TOF53985.1 hypothetical protein CGJ20_24470 [Vibrio parahaemolyticus]